MKTSKTAFLILIFIFATTFISAQKPKSKIKPKPKTPVKTDSKTAEKGLFDFLDDPKYQESLKNLDSAERKQAEEFFKKGEAFWKEFEISKAIDAFSDALRLYPNYPDALRMRGTVFYMISKYAEAVADFDAFLKITPNNAEILAKRGAALSGIAENLLETEIERKKANDTAQRSLADFNKAIELNPKEYLYFNWRGKLLFDFSFYKEAIDDFQKAIGIESKNPYSYTYLGYAKFADGDGNGISEINKAIEIEPKFPDAYFMRANIYRRLGLLDKALQDYGKAIEHNKYNAKYYNGRGMVYFALQEGDAAVADFTRAIGEKNDFGMAYFNRAMTYKKYPYSVSTDDKMDPFLKIPLQRQKMLEDFSAAIKFKPNLADAYIQRGIMNSTALGIGINGPDAEEIKELNAALADFQQAIKIDPNAADAYNGRGGCYDQLGKKDLALADYTKAIELDPELATAYMGRMGIYCEMGKKELSIADEKKVKALGYAALNMCSLGK